MNNRQRRILKQARRAIKRGRERFVCEAIAGATGRKKDKKYLIRYIERMLFPHPTLNSWLFYNRQLLWNVKKYRLQWIDWMLEKGEK